MNAARPTLAALLAIAAPAGADENAADAPPAAAPSPNAVTTTAPATRPAAPDAEALLAAVNDLSHPDADARRRAFDTLMGMTRDDLDAFRAVVAECRPLDPSQAAVLREIVTQAYLAGEPYRAMPVAGFMGVKLQVVAVSSVAEAEAAGANVGLEVPPAAAAPATPAVGILIAERVPGFCGARSFYDGDVVLSIVGLPLRMTADRNEIDLTREFSTVVREVGAGNVVTFDVLRRGRVVRVPVKLDPRPEVIDPAFGAGAMALDEFQNARRRKADQYWNETFRPLLGEQVG